MKFYFLFLDLYAEALKEAESLRHLKEENDEENRRSKFRLNDVIQKKSETEEQLKKLSEEIYHL